MIEVDCPACGKCVAVYDRPGPIPCPNCMKTLPELPRPAKPAPEPAPIDVMLFCPVCVTQHIDAPTPGTGWDNPPHRSHLCHKCGTVWRPADVPTNGVLRPKTRGKDDTF